MKTVVLFCLSILQKNKKSQTCYLDSNLYSKLSCINSKVALSKDFVKDIDRSQRNIQLEDYPLFQYLEIKAFFYDLFKELL